MIGKIMENLREKRIDCLKNQIAFHLGRKYGSFGANCSCNPYEAGTSEALWWEGGRRPAYARKKAQDKRDAADIFNDNYRGRGR